MPCPDSNNPDGIKCPTDMRRFAQVGNIDKWKVTHSRNEVVSLSCGEADVVVLSRVRDSRYEVTSDAKSDAISCQMASGSTSQYQHNFNYVTNEYYQQLSDSFTTIDRFVQYMDLRNDFILYREEEDRIDRTDDAKGNVLWNQYGVTLWLTKFTPEDSEVNETHKSGPVIVASSPHTSVLESGYAYGLPVTMGQPQNNEPEQYWLWNASSAENVGGYDLYHPEWLQGASARPEYDDADRVMRWRFVAPDSTVGATSSGELSIDVSIADPDPTKCSAAHDRFGRYMVSMTDVNGAYRAVITDTTPEGNEDASLTEEETSQLLGGTKLAYPIGIS